MRVFDNGCGLVYDQCGWNKCMKVYNFGIILVGCFVDILTTCSSLLICRSWCTQVVLYC
jgi:hypothetical protein